MTRSLSLRLMAMLAWLILVMTPLSGISGAAMKAMSHAGHAVCAEHAVAHVGHPAFAAGAGGCCDNQGAGSCLPHDACPCASLCASALPVMAMTDLMRVSPGTPLLGLRRIDAPNGVHVPLLRPPAA